MIFSDINPFIRFARHENILPCRNQITYSAYDNRIFICTVGQGTITVNDVSYPMKPGALIMWKAGDTYEYNVDDSMTLSGCNFDFTCNNIYKDIAIPPKANGNIPCNELVENVQFEDMRIFNNPVYIEKASDLIPLMNTIIDEFESKLLYYEKKCGGLLAQILAETSRAASVPVCVDSLELLHKIIEYIKENYNKNITNKSIGEVFNYHPNYVSRLIKQYTGLSLHQYIITYRINVAITLLKSGNMSVTEISSKIGFCDVMYFSRYFKKMTGKSPSFYKPI